MLLGYNTNGFAHHRIEDALEIMAEIGYRAAAITLEHTELDPPNSEGVDRCVGILSRALERTGLHATIETGSRFILDPRRKHQPTLLSGDPADRSQRVEFLKAALDVANGLGASVVSLWSGAPVDGASAAVLRERLIGSLKELLKHAERRKVNLAFEPEPGMFIKTMDDFRVLHDAMANPRFGLTLDVGHVHCLNDGGLSEHVHRWKDTLWNVHLEDMRAEVHEHLMFGEGEIDFASVFSALQAIQYTGPVHVELSRHSHDAVRTARAAFEFLKQFEFSAG